jgi:microcompartment protein CcmL/EutN
VLACAVYASAQSESVEHDLARAPQVSIEGDVAAVKAAIEVGTEAASQVGEVVSMQVIPRPHDEVSAILPRATAAKK